MARGGHRFYRYPVWVPGLDGIKDPRGKPVGWFLLLKDFRANDVVNLVEYTRMFRRRKSRFLKGFASLFLALQMHLLWVAVAHSHELEEVVLSTHRVLRETNNCDSSAAAKSRYCVVCQIVRQSAVRPAVARAAPKPATLTRLGPGTSSAGFDSRQPAPTYGRAPPLT